MRRFMSMVVPAVFVLVVGVAAEVQRKDIDIRVSDGIKVKGTYFSPNRPGPAILLLHQCNMDRHAWDELATDLAAAGFHVLTVDFRGYGESGGERVREKWPGDVDAMYAYLLAQKGVDASRVGAGGASCGVTQAAELVARQPKIKTLMVLSGTATDAAKTYIAETPALVIFGAAAEGDTRNVAGITGIRQILAASKNPASTLKVYAGEEHGVPMFAKNPELKPMIVTWWKGQLVSKVESR